MIIFAIDPGTEKSAFIIMEYKGYKILDFGITSNEDMRYRIKSQHHHTFFACEMIAHYGSGMPAGKSIFDTCVWIGRFIECTKNHMYLLERQKIKLHLCGNMRAKDANVRQALLDRYPATGGGKTPQIGTKKAKGALYGIHTHIWSALAVAIYFSNVILSKE